MSTYYEDETTTLLHGDSIEQLRTLGDRSVDCIVTSPPYFGLRDYGNEGQYGLEASPAEYVETMRQVFTEARRVLVDDGTLWLNLGDSYSSSRGSLNDGLNERWGNAAGQRKQEQGAQRSKVSELPAKNLIGIPWRVAFALQGDGWILRNAIIWNKPNAMPESVTDRMSCRYELVFLFAKSQRYAFDLDPIREASTSDRSASRRARKPSGDWKPNSAAGPWDGESETRNPGDVWEIATQPFPGAHFASMPPKLAERCILAGCKPGGTVLDPFSGSGTTGMVAAQLGRKYVGIDLSSEYLDLSLRTRLAQSALFDGAAS